MNVAKIQDRLTAARRWLFNPWMKATRFVWLSVVVFGAVFVAGVVAQWNGMLYGGFDLGIFDQVLWNSARGDLFAYSFDSANYLADHRAWALLLLVPFYWIAPHPLTLLVLQVVVVALGAVTAYIAVRSALQSRFMQLDRLGLSDEGVQVVASIVGLVYLLHPFVQNMVLFEFHLLPLTMPLVFLLITAVLEERFSMVWVWSICILLIRDDLSLLTAGVGLLLLVQAIAPGLRSTNAQSTNAKKSAVHGAALVVVSAVWLYAMARIGAALIPSGTTKFFIFYEWLGATPAEALQFILLNPWQTLVGALSKDHALTAIVILSSFSFVGLLRLRFLLPAAAVLAPYFLVSEDIFISMVSSHYAAPAIPWLLIAALIGGSRVFTYVREKDFSSWAIQPSTLLLVSFAAIFVMHISVLFPFHLHRTYAELYDPAAIEALDAVVAEIQEENANTEHERDSVMTTSRLYPLLSQREHLYSTQHPMSGKQHYSHLDYVAPERVDWLVFEKAALLNASELYSSEVRVGADERFQSIIDDNSLVLHTNNEYVLVYKRVEGSVNGGEEVASDGGESVSSEDNSETDIAQPLIEGSVQVINAPVYQQVGSFRVWEPMITEDGLYVTMLQQVQPANTYAQEDLHAQVTWFNSAGVELETEVAQLGGLNQTSTWEKGDRNTAYAPLTIPVEAESATVHVGPLQMQKSETLLFAAVRWEILPEEAGVWTELEIE